jgi:hypothetical protein
MTIHDYKLVAQSKETEPRVTWDDILALQYEVIVTTFLRVHRSELEAMGTWLDHLKIMRRPNDSTASS